MRIAIFTDMYLEVAGGIPSSVQAQKQALERLGHTVLVFCPGSKVVDDSTIIVVPSCHFLRPGGAPLARRPRLVEKAILEQMPDFAARFDLVHVHYEAGCSLAGVRLAKRFGLPLVQTMHGREDMAVTFNVPRPFKFLVSCSLNGLHNLYLPHSLNVAKDRKFANTWTKAKMWTLMVNQANYADIVLTPSAHFGRKLKLYGVKKPIEILPSGISEDLVTTAVKARCLAQSESLVLIWNSRVSREKRILPFLAALAGLKREFTMAVYGNGNQLKAAKRFVKRHGMARKVRFYGEKSRTVILRAMTKAHLAIMASYQFDTQGLTLLEAEAMGLPVFFCDPDMKEVVPAGSFVCSKGPGVEAMATALEQLMEQPANITKMSQIMLQYRHEIMQDFRIKKLEKVYQELVKKCGHTGL